jgi:hypothetical protein
MGNSTEIRHDIFHYINQPPFPIAKKAKHLPIHEMRWCALFIFLFSENMSQPLTYDSDNPLAVWDGPYHWDEQINNRSQVNNSNPITFFSNVISHGSVPL